MFVNLSIEPKSGIPLIVR